MIIVDESRRLSKITMFGLSAIAMMIFLIAAISFSNWAVQDSRAKTIRSLTTLGSSERLLGLIRDAETGQRGFILTEDESFLEPYNLASKALAQMVSKLAEIVKDNPDQAKRVLAISKTIELRMAKLADNIARVRNGRKAEAVADISAGSGKALMDSIRLQFKEIDETEAAALAVRLKNEGRYRFFNESALVLAIAILLLIGWLNLRVLQARSLELDAANAELESRVFQRTKEMEAEKQSAEALLKEVNQRERFLQSVLASSSDCIKILDLEGRLLMMTEGGQEVMEVADFSQIKDCPWPAFWEGEELLLAENAVEKANEGIRSSFQGYANTFKGNRRYWDVQVTPILGEDGKPNSILSVSRDVTLMKQAELQRAELTNEMAHRIKNAFTVVQAIVTQTLRHSTSIEAGREAVAGRIAALARAQDLLTQSLGGNNSIRWVVQEALAAHRTGAGRFNLDGPDLELTGEQGLGLSLAIYELSTNAIKYGSLSNDGGRVLIEWSSPDGHLFEFQWREEGGPLVVAPTQSGFGSKLVERIVAPYFQGTAKLEYEPEGVIFKLSGTLKTVAATAKTAA